MPSNIDLSGLKDIHLPPVPSAFPPNENVWYISAGVIVLSFLIRFALKRRRQVTAKAYAFAEIERIAKRGTARDKITALLGLLRRMALMKFPKERVAVLHGTQWSTFLKDTLKSKTLDARAAYLIEQAAYLPPDQLKNTDVAPLAAVVRQWAAEHL